MFSSQAKSQQTKLSLFVLNSPLTPQSHLDLFLGNNTEANLPVLISGDKMRLQQVLVSLVKSAMERSKGMPINILVAYDLQTANLSVQITDEGQGLDE